jgi:CRP/FNR family transcriptional regulator
MRATRAARAPVLRPSEDEAIHEAGLIRKSVKRGDALYRPGERFVALFAVRAGFLKTSLALANGRDQVTGFYMSGDMLGMEGIGNGVHTLSAVALEDSEVSIVPYSTLREAGPRAGALQRQVQKLMSKAIVQQQGVMLLLGSMSAQQRLAAFLLNLAERLGARDGSQAALLLPMPREDIGSHLGLTIETVSRSLGKLETDGLLEVQNKRIRIPDVKALKKSIFP